MWLKWLPWRYIIRSLARRHGFVDPLSLMARMSQFGEPSEIAVPTELLRAGAIFHARGLMNTSAIQHNLDWVWPFWVERQFNPRDEAFVPRAFSVTHVNLTHRNWTAVGLPGCDLYPVVDPRGLVTPHFDGWSIDGWIIADDGRLLLPSRSEDARQSLVLENDLEIVTQFDNDPFHLTSEVDVVLDDDAEPICRQRWTAMGQRAGWFVVSLRPYNPEGVSFVYEIQLDDNRQAWTIDGAGQVWFSRAAERHFASDYRHGDVSQRIPRGKEVESVECHVGMATAAALFRLEPDTSLQLGLRIPLSRSWTGGGRAKPSIVKTRPASSNKGQGRISTWTEVIAPCAELDIPDAEFQFLYDAALRMLALHTPGDVFPGPFTYKRFWVRDAAYMLHAMLCAGLHDQVRRALPRLLSAQRSSGYFHSQEGEWDSNGEALWTLGRYCELTGDQPPTHWRRPLLRGGRWIIRKRIRRTDAPHAGLLPPGFSAEHLGPNDYYYFDDYWSIAGLRSAAALLDRLGDIDEADRLRLQGDDLLAAVDRSLRLTGASRAHNAIPASPYRRMDAGAVGSLAGGYPTRILEPRDPRLLATAEFLRENCLVRDAFFQDMIHSGINVYLTLHIAQVLLAAGNPEWFELVDAVARLASPTGQWPEAIHPRTGGGCMGDGQHMWAAAEWVMALRNAFVREEDNRLILCSGLPQRWIASGKPMSFGPAPTPWGNVTVSTERHDECLTVRWEGAWRKDPPPLEVRPFGFRAATERAEVGKVFLEPATSEHGKRE